MSEKFPDLDEAHLRLSRTRTWGGLETAAAYGPAEPDADYAEQLGDPGQFPYARGSYPQMYRSRMWTQRTIVGYGTPADTRAGLEAARAQGATGLDVVLDTLSQEALDPDHPMFSPEVGSEGCSITWLPDLRVLLGGIDLTATDIAWHATVLLYPLVLAYAQEQGFDLTLLQGSHMPDHVTLTLSGYGDKLLPVDLAQRATVDTLEHVARHTPRWATGFPQCYNLRERGLTPVAEIAVGMAIVNATLADLAGRGIGVDAIAPSMAWVSTTDVDLFEEVAKFRALRRIWARTMRERFGSADPRSQRLRIACHTSGRALPYQQPLNNLARATVQTLAAILGGVQAVETAAYDEPVSIPTPAARELAIRTQQILAHEVGAARTADPLGGSWYVEALTDDLEAAALGLLGQIEAEGLLAMVGSGRLEELIDEHNHRTEREMIDGERLKVGVNAFRSEHSTPPPRFALDHAAIAAHIDAFKRRKAARDLEPVRTGLRDIRGATAAGENAIPAMVRAFRADATSAEVWGAFRLGLGHPFDPFGAVSPPVPLD
ncbi:MAG: methylmalonyl-CoA mutase family protein [Sporichthyaceae bacterium]